MKKRSRVGILGVITGILIGIEFGYRWINIQYMLSESSGFAQLGVQIAANALKTTIILGGISALCCFIAAVGKVPWAYLIGDLLMGIGILEMPQKAAEGGFLTECVVFLILMVVSFAVDRALIKKEKSDEDNK